MEYLWKADLEDGTYRNPLIFADYSDPDVIRVEDTYYMTASSFNYVPGLPILISKDLVNWKLVNYALDKIDYEKYDIPQHAKGVWAPAIRYHDGRFFIYYGMPDEGIFMVSTKDPLGKWDEPVLVLEGKGLIDSCPFWDEDGKAYVVHGYAKSRIGFKSYLGIFPMSPDGKKAIGEDHFIFDGVETQPTIEGPKVYKRNGYYYILAPAGGVKTGWQTALRSKNIYGPYEEKIVMKQGNSIVNGPHQGGLTDTVNGEEWFIHFQDRGLYGRIIHMQPVVWENDWLVIGINAQDGCGEPCLVYDKPKTGVSEQPSSLEASDDFNAEKLNLMWQWLGNPKESFYSLTENTGCLRLYALNPSGKAEPILWECANVLTQKLVCPYFKAVTCVRLSGLKEKGQAGMVMMGGHYAYLAVRIVDGDKTLVYSEAYDAEDGIKERTSVIRKLENNIEKINISFAMEEGGEGKENGEIQEGKKSNDAPVFKMYYSLEDGDEVNVPTNFVPSDHTWVGAKIGLFANVYEDGMGGAEVYNRESNNVAVQANGYADFEFIHVSAE
ncbi:MAG: glycoside hydrolase 43 family protein [Butyrivibrio sp.]|nr:glycoside hydrolase 43 family protein [Butyrivibrio sp.]